MTTKISQALFRDETPESVTNTPHERKVMSHSNAFRVDHRYYHGYRRGFAHAWLFAITIALFTCYVVTRAGNGPVETADTLQVMEEPR